MPTPPDPDDLTPVRPDYDRIALWGMSVWAVALVATLAIPTLRGPGREWWPWCAVLGVLLGLVGWSYLRRRRGNAALLG